MTTKQQFIEHAQRIIDARITLTNWIETQAEPIIKKFGGKICNKRIVTALKAVKLPDLLISLEIWYPNNLTLKFRYKGEGLTWQDEQDLYLDLKTERSLSDGKYYIDSASTLRKYHESKVFFDKYTDEQRAAIDNYDELMAEWRDLENRMYEWNKKPALFREHVDSKRSRLY